MEAAMEAKIRATLLTELAAEKERMRTAGEFFLTSIHNARELETLLPNISSSTDAACTGVSVLREELCELQTAREQAEQHRVLEQKAEEEMRDAHILESIAMKREEHRVREAGSDFSLKLGNNYKLGHFASPRNRSKEVKQGPMARH